MLGATKEWVGTGTTNAAGQVVFTLPAGYFTAIVASVPVALSTIATTYRPAFVFAESVTSISVQVWTVTVGGALAAAGAGITTDLVVYGR
jgi:hypothetical protein